MKRTLRIDFSPVLLDLWLLALRVLTSAFMFTHGLPKFYKLMQGGEIQFGDPIGLGPVASLSLAVFAEVICSTFILIGLGTRIATLPLMITMSVAAFIAHADDPFRQKEAALLYLLLYITLAVLGSGKYSVDQLLTKKLTVKK
jgi:putative oxidoreductase